jgi:NADH-quinone oxidoreductase subunit L
LIQAILIPLLPLLGWAANGLAGRRWGPRMVAVVACGTVVASFLAALALFRQMSALPPDARRMIVDLYPWITTGPVQIPLRLLVDPLSIAMALVISGVGALIHLYSIGYMAGDDGFARYFAYLNLFMASMLWLVMAGDLVVVFIGWEGVGLCSYLLIAFWFARPAAARAGVKAFLVTRLGDVGFLLGIFLAASIFGTTDLVAMTQAAGSRLAEGGTAATVLTLFLFLGATGKSAQLPLHVWLPDAMEGPTPVSALIHAATMVTAGVYMIVRLHALYLRAPLAMDVVAITGAITAVFAAASALVEPDLKRVLAYSTISQLGYMFLAVGVGAWSAGIFHLTSHAFFKALLFLAAGSVMHALAGETDMRRMGGLARRLPFTAGAFAVGALALAGIPPLSGFFSKDRIISEAFHTGHPWLWAAALTASGLTSIYIVRAFALTFMARPPAAAPSSAVAPSSSGAGHSASSGTPSGPTPPPLEPPAVMTWPMWALGILTFAGGGLGWSLARPGALDLWLGPVVGSRAAAGEGTLVVVSLAVALAGIALAWLIFVARSIRARSDAVRGVLAHQFYIEGLYNVALVGPSQAFARDAAVFDRAIDGAATAIARAVAFGGAVLRRFQSGYLRHYATFVLLGALLMLAYWIWR